jgi:hypothetical protein
MQDEIPPKSPMTKKPVSPAEAFRTRHDQEQSPPAPKKRSSSPADMFRERWLAGGPAQQPAGPNTKFTLAELAESYRKDGTERKYVKRDIWLPNPKQEIDEQTLEEMESQGFDDLTQLSHSDELDPVDEVDAFGGEITRDYQGVMPLKSGQQATQKYRLKQGTLMESRGYISP